MRLAAKCPGREGCQQDEGEGATFILWASHSQSISREGFTSQLALHAADSLPVSSPRKLITLPIYFIFNAHADLHTNLICGDGWCILYTWCKCRKKCLQEISFLVQQGFTYLWETNEFISWTRGERTCLVISSMSKVDFVNWCNQVELIFIMLKRARLSCGEEETITSMYKKKEWGRGKRGQLISRFDPMRRCMVALLEGASGVVRQRRRKRKQEGCWKLKNWGGRGVIMWN